MGISESQRIQPVWACTAPAVATATAMAMDGLSRSVETYRVSSNFDIAMIEVSCAQALTVSDEYDLSSLIGIMDRQGAHVAVGSHKSRRPKAPQDVQHHMSFFPPGAQQWWFFDGPVQQLRWVLLQFDRTSLAERFEEHFEAPEFRPHHMFFDAELYRVLHHVERACLADTPLTALYDDALAVAVLRALGRMEATRFRHGLNPGQRRRLADYMRERLADNIRLKELSDLVGLSPTHFCRAFKDAVGVSPHAWQLQERIRVAKIAMNDRTAALADVALRVGFHDQAHFAKSFSRIVGIAPGRWRQLHCR